MSWEMVEISKVANVITGTTPSKSNNEFYEGGDIPFVTPRELGANHPIHKATTYLTDKGFLKANVVPKFSILVCCIGSIGKMGIAGREIATNQQINSVVFDSSLVDYRYGYRALSNVKSTMINSASSTTIAILNKSNFERIKIPLPPLPEQQRIANILDKAEAINQKRAQVLVLCDEFLRATFLDMFGHHFSSKGYPSSTKKSIALLTDYIDYRGKTPKKTEYGIPLITAKNVRKGYVDEEPREFISEDLYDDWMTRGLPLKNDVLFTTEAPLGNVALLGEYEKVAVGQRLVSLRCKEEVTPIYFMYALLDRYTQQLIFQRSSGSTVKGIRTKELYQIEIPTPPIELQQKFSSIVEKVNAIKARIQHAQELPLFEALSQQAFKGELTL